MQVDVPAGRASQRRQCAEVSALPVFTFFRDFAGSAFQEYSLLRIRAAAWWLHLHLCEPWRDGFQCAVFGSSDSVDYHSGLRGHICVRTSESPPLSCDPSLFFHRLVHFAAGVEEWALPVGGCSVVGIQNQDATEDTNCRVSGLCCGTSLRRLCNPEIARK